MNRAKSAIFHSILSKKNLQHTEGEKAIKNLNTLCSSIGYRSEGFKFGSSFEMFLQDNSGCVDVIHDWMAQNLTDEQLQDMGFIPGDDEVGD